MSRVAVRAALEQRLATLSPAIDTVYGNDAYIPVDGRPYQRVNVLFARPGKLETGPNFLQRGYLAVLLLYPPGDGWGDAGERADMITALFPPGTSMTSGGVTVNVEEPPEEAAPVPDDTRFALPVNVYFFASLTA